MEDGQFAHVRPKAEGPIARVLEYDKTPGRRDIEVLILNTESPVFMVDHVCRAFM
jgi:hypothetical protein